MKSQLRSADFLVIGQGLAGSLLVWELKRLGAKVLIVDPGEETTSSKVAAGLLTPVTGRFFARSWRLDDVLPAAEAFYAEVEAEFEEPYFHSVPVARIFRTEIELERYQKRLASGELEGLGSEIPVGETFGGVTEVPLGGFEMARAGYLDVPGFLKACRSRWVDDLVEGRVEEDDLEELEGGGVLWKKGNVVAKTVIFCQGFGGVGSKLFNFVPFDPAKGEILDVEVPDLGTERTLNRGCWLVPVKGRFRSGATYDREILDTQTTEEAREDLRERLNAFLKVPFEIVGQKAAVRPIVRGHHPVSGRHPGKPDFAIFNGLASKGVLNGPFFARNLARNLMLNEPADEGVDVSRWY